ncbi:NrsF family protein [Aestuariivirga sp.]|uniref:NrsF family protein n=1 Tax=Aestuariivirga sp. TaxID=2650926 RepID=UPI003BA8E82D
MKTQDLIGRLSADSQPQQGSPRLTLALAVFAAAAVAVLLMLFTIGPRPDIAEASGTWRFDFKFLVTVTLAATGYFLLSRALYPEGLQRAPLWLLLAAPALLLGAAVFELWALPHAMWGTKVIGTNWLYCLTLVPAFGIVPLVLALWAIRQGATTRPVLTGFLSGLVAGGLAATAYAAHCPDDSPLFVAVWYPIGILTLGAIGAVAGRAVLRW